MEECKQGLFAQTIYQNNKTEYSELLDTDIQNVLVQERSVGGRYDIGILSLFKTNLSLLYLFFIVYILTKMRSHSYVTLAKSILG